MSPTDFALGSLALAALILPGWLSARATRLPVPLLAGFLAGTAGLVALVVVFAAVKIPLRAATLLPAWVLVIAGTALACRRHPRPAPPRSAPAPVPSRRGASTGRCSSR